MRIRFFIWIVFLISAISYSQDKIIEYDFLNNKYTKGTDATVKSGDQVQFVVLQVNRFIYTVNITTQKNRFFTEPPAQFKEKLLPATVNATKKNPDSTEIMLADNFTASFDVYKQSVLKLNEITDGYNFLSELVKRKNLAFTDINKSKESYIDTYFAGEHPEITDRKIMLDRCCGDRINEEAARYRELVKLAESDEQKKQLKEVKDEVDKAKFPEARTKLVNLYTDINPGNFTFSSQIESASFEDADEIVFEIKISDKEEAQTADNKDFKLNVAVVCGWKFDFSTGVFATNVIDYKYLTKKDSVINGSDTTRGQRIIKDDQGNFKLGLDALLHISYKWKYFGAGINFGVGLMGDPQTIRYLLGGSIYIGRKQRFILNGGLCLGSVDRLKTTLEENTLYKDEVTPETGTKTLMGWYVSISYNL